MNSDFCFSCMGKLPDGHFPGCENITGEENPHYLKPGTVLNERYLIGQPIGVGGFGITYVGLDTVLDMRIAVKEFYPSQFSIRNNNVSPEITVTAGATVTAGDNNYEKSKIRFLEEARTLARFNNFTGIVNVRDYFEANNTAYIIMEYIDGTTLKGYLENTGNFEAADIVKKMRPVIESLAKVHEQGLIHRDISPDNIKMTADGDMKLLDFGSARFISADLDKTVTTIYKDGYAPEEQYRTDGKQGSWTDVYAVCATIYKCITGQTPASAPNRSGKITRNIQDIETPSQLGVNISPGLEHVIMRGMSYLQENRYQTMNELLSAINDAEKPVVAVPPVIAAPPSVVTAQPVVAAPPPVVTAQPIANVPPVVYAQPTPQGKSKNWIPAIMAGSGLLVVLIVAVVIIVINNNNGPSVPAYTPTPTPAYTPTPANTPEQTPTAPPVISDGVIIPGMGGSVHVNGVTEYTFIPRDSGIWEFQTSDNDGDPYLEIFENNNRIAYDDDSGSGFNSLIQQNLTAGNIYTVTAGFYGSGDGSYTLSVTFGGGGFSDNTDNSIVGRWSYVSGSYLWYFSYSEEAGGQYGDIEFFPDGRVTEHAWGEPGLYTMSENNSFSVYAQWEEVTYLFTYSISGNELTIYDHNNDSAVYRRQ